MVGRRRHRHVARREPPSGRQQRFAFVEIEPLRAKVVADRNGAFERDPIAFAPDVLLHDDRVGACRNGRAGEDAHSFAWADRPGEGPPGGGLADHVKGNGEGAGVRGAQGVAIHRRIGERRLEAARDDVARQCAAKGLGERDELLVERTRNGGEHARQRLLDRHQRGAAHPSIPARQCPDLPPRLSISRSASMRMPRSAALAMS